MAERTCKRKPPSLRKIRCAELFVTGQAPSLRQAAIRAGYSKWTAANPTWAGLGEQELVEVYRSQHPELSPAELVELTTRIAHETARDESKPAAARLRAARLLLQVAETLEDHR